MGSLLFESYEGWNVKRRNAVVYFQTSMQMHIYS